MRTNTNENFRPNQQEVTGFDSRRTQLEISPNAHPRDVEIHQDVARQTRRDNSLVTRAKETVFGSNRDTPVNSRKYELELEAQKHERMADWRESEAAKLPADHPDRPRLLAEANAFASARRGTPTEAQNLNDQQPKGKVAADDDVFNLDPKQAKNRMWPSKGRPGNFARDTLDTLATQQPNEHVPGSTNLDGNLSRNHIIAFDHRVKVTVNEIRGMTVAEITTYVKNKYGVDVSENTITGVLDTLKVPLVGDYNDPNGLYVGESGDNSSLGSRMRHANDRRAKIDPITDPDAFRAASREVAELTVDVPPGKVGGQDLTNVETTTIRKIEQLETDWQEISDLRTEAQEINTGAKPVTDASPEFAAAFAEYTQLKRRIDQLKDFSKDGSPTANTQVQEALVKAVQMERLLSEVLFSR
ncbi:MAG: hypothetical protein HC933_16380 [Pleurocapsa sp. SU_196_0]|nr:hypothetical protein [Pleurocapsa sp. SU_196_0]